MKNVEFLSKISEYLKRSWLQNLLPRFVVCFYETESNIDAWFQTTGIGNLFLHYFLDEFLYLQFFFGFVRNPDFFFQKK